MAKYEIKNTVSGLVLGTFEGNDKDQALNAMAKKAGYYDYANLKKYVPGEYDDLAVEEITISTFEELIDTVNPYRKDSLDIAKANGANWDQLVRLANADKVAQPGHCLLLPKNRLEGLSRGRGWCGLRAPGKRSGPFEEFAEESTSGRHYKANKAGRWTVGATDGFNRKRSDDYVISELKIGEATFLLID